MNNNLNPEEIGRLRKRHKTEKSRDICDRIKAVILRDKGWSEAKIAEALLVHLDTVKRHLKDYHNMEQKLKSENGGSSSKLDDTKTTELIEYLQVHTYTKSKDICEYGKAQYGIT
ncbi:helix-turn-helix domain-containing protein [Candidatus Tisiphia endosymbiont of Beris chalybata]|uniref:helix-turn-helix domain-containing protein n=1 Tax=Candidatus Tisiphia endosymbiont of Beris chalybata TaxID=3066262 RepID=UPI00312C9B8B